MDRSPLRARPLRARPLRALAAATALLTVGALAACSTDDTAADGGRIDVVTAFYPMQYIAERIGGDRVAVANLVKPGAEPHDLELSPGQMAELSEAGLVVYLRGFQPAVDEAVDGQAKDKAFDAAAVQPLLDAPEGAEDEHAGEAAAAEEKHANEGKDLHLWLDPVRLAAIGDGLADRFAAIDSAHADDFRQRAAALRKDLEALDKEYTQGLATCQRREIVTSHAAFGYLTDRYKLQQIPISGLSPEEEPTPQRVTEVATLAKEKGVTVIFFETLVSPKIAETLAREVGAKAEVLDPLEGLAPDAKGDYLTVMRDNLTRLRGALGCS